MKTIATIKQIDGQLAIELRDEDGTLIDVFPVDEVVNPSSDVLVKHKDEIVIMLKLVNANYLQVRGFGGYYDTISCRLEKLLTKIKEAL